MIWRSSIVPAVTDPGATGELGGRCDVENVKARIGIGKKSLTTENLFLLQGCPLRQIRNIPAIAGIYLLTEGWELGYIGSSLNMRARLAWHRTYGQWARGAWVRWIPYDEDQENEMRVAEHHLIFQLCPSRNTIMNPASDSPYSGVSYREHLKWKSQNKSVEPARKNSVPTKENPPA